MGNQTKLHTGLARTVSVYNQQLQQTEVHMISPELLHNAFVHRQRWPVVGMSLSWPGYYWLLFSRHLVIICEV